MREPMSFIKVDTNRETRILTGVSGARRRLLSRHANLIYLYIGRLLN